MIGETDSALRMTGSCVGMKTGQFLKLFGVASVLLNLCLLGFYEGYKKDYWDLGQSLASYHEMRVDMNHNIWNATQTHNRLVYEKTMAEQKQLLYQLLNSTRSDERTQNLVQRINDDIQSNAEIVDEIEQNMYNNGFSDNEGGYSPITSYMTYTRLFQTPLDDLFYVSTVTLFFSMLGIYGVTCKQRSLVQTYLIFNLAHLVLSFTLFVDIIGTNEGDEMNRPGLALA